MSAVERWNAVACVLIAGLAVASCDGDDAGHVPSPAEPVPTYTDDGDDTDPPTTTKEPGTTETPVAPVSKVAVEVHPDVVTMLNVSWTQDEAVDAAWIEFTTDEVSWSASPRRDGEAGAHAQVALGVHADTDVTVRIVNEIAGAVAYSDQTWTQRTGPLPAELVAPTVTLFDVPDASAHPWMLGSMDVDREGIYGGPFYVFVMDRDGRYVWYHEVPDSKLALYVRPARNGGHIVIDESANYVFDSSVIPAITRLSLDMGLHETVFIDSYGFVYDELGDGSLIYEDDEDDIVLMQRNPDGSRVVMWNCSEWLQGLGYTDFGCRPNGINWVESTDTVLWSMYNNDTVVEVDRKTGTVLRQMGQLAGGWVFDPSESVFDYQHFPNYTADGTLMISTHVLGIEGEMRAREFALDDAGEVLQEVWSFGAETEHYGTYAGEAVRLSNGNTLIGYGSGGALLEVTADGEVVWEVLWRTDFHEHLIGHMTLLDDLYALTSTGG